MQSSCLPHGVARAGCLAAILAAAGCGPLTVSFTLGDDAQRLRRVVLDHDPGATRDIVVIDVRGLIADQAPAGLLGSSPNPVDSITRRLERAADDPATAAIILRINSPGGTVTASEMLYREVRRVADQAGKPIVAHLGEVAASGGYYLALSADRIVAEPSAITGSIGVMMPTVNVSGGLSRLGIQSRAVTSGPNKDLANPLEPIDESHYAVLQGMVDEYYQTFRGRVRERRPAIDPGAFDRLTDGRIVTGAEAVRTGLADEAGGIREAFAAAKSLAGVEKARLVVYSSRSRGGSSIYSAESTAPAPADPAWVDALVARLGVLDARPYYIWMP